MLRKLIKYDFKATYLKMLSTTALYVILAIAIPYIIFPFSKEASTIYATVIVAMGSFAYCAITTIFIFQHFNSNIYGNEGYLMSTLPTNGYMLLLSKFIVAFIWNIIAFVVSALSFVTLTSVYSNTVPKIADVITKFFAEPQAMSIIGDMVQMLVAMLIGFAVVYMSIYLSIAISKLPLWGKFGTLLGVVSFFVLMFIESVPSSIIKSFEHSSLDFDSNSINAIFDIFARNNFFTDMWWNTLIDVAFAVIFFFAAGWLIDKKTSLK